MSETNVSTATPVRLAAWLKPLRAPISKALKLQRDARCRRRKGMPIKKRAP